MASEETPLLTDQAVIDHEAVYKRFTPGHKRIILAITALVATFPVYTSGMFVPLIPQIARDLDSTPSVVSLAVSLSVLANAVGSLTWASYSGFYGRRPILLLSMLTLAVASVGSGSASSVPSLLIWRIIQAFGAASGLSVGIAVLADIYKMEERGTASGAFFGAILFGMALAPTIAGASAYYWSWRTTQYQLFWAAALAFILTYQFQPETSQPGARGLDKLIEKEGRSRWVWLNPFKNIILLRSPNVLFISLAEGCVVITDYVLLVPIAYTFGQKYGITNEAIIGALCIPVGLGNIIGSNLAGRYSDKLVISLRERRGGVWVPEDRLRATLLGGIILTPCSILVSGFAIQFTEGRLSIIINTICLVLNGVGVSVVFNPANAYLVDILHDRSAEVTSANMAVRCVIVAVLVGFIIPSLETFGVAATFAGAAGISWLGYGLICLVIVYGGRLRAWVDLGFSTQQNN
ncbi:major facilitator superfamily domain-containing protein [Irpex rosettiformis]|uniref:Major facilitator superfamily domain-containing protein n=1 Tax=Irpex rosettiformis TaxID=378272 RepID=A0ACB8U3W4_9APHY|nr:major facilitator superfamily domain-containing protein [Irpex rosettiformis]